MVKEETNDDTSTVVDPASRDYGNVLGGKASEEKDTTKGRVKKVVLTVYYGSQCGDSAQFFRHQLGPTKKRLKHLLEINFVPFGKAKMERNGKFLKFECQHGQQECEGNMWHVCAVEHLKEDLDAQFNFTECMLHDMSRGTLKEVATKCSVSTKVFGAISSCVTGSQGKELLEKAGNATSGLSPPLSLTQGWSPTYTLATIPPLGKQDRQEADCCDMGGQLLTSQVCDVLRKADRKKHYSGCRNPNEKGGDSGEGKGDNETGQDLSSLADVEGGPTMEIYYSSRCSDSRDFIVNQVGPLWGKIKEFVNVVFVPYGRSETLKDGAGNVSFVCQHPEKHECQANLWHVCGVKHASSKELRFNFINCMVDNLKSSPHETALRCSKSAALGSDWSSVSRCVNGQEGKRLHEEAGEKTDKLRPRINPGMQESKGNKIPTYLLLKTEREKGERFDAEFQGDLDLVKHPEKHLQSQICAAFKEEDGAKPLCEATTDYQH